MPRLERRGHRCPLCLLGHPSRPRKSTRASIAQDLRPQALSNANVLFHCFVGWKSGIRVSAGLVPPEASVLGL
jgi:hypothetical protein